MRRRVIICLGLLLALCLIGDAIAMLSLRRSIAQLSDLATAHAIQTMRADLTANSARIEADLASLLNGDPRSTDRRRDNIRRFETSLNRCNSCHHRSDIQAQLERVHRTFASYVETVEHLYADPGGQADPLTVSNVRHLAELVSLQATAMSDQAAPHIAVRSQDVTAGIHSAWLVLLGTLLAALALGGFVALHLKNRLTRPVDALLAGVERLQRGDGDHRIVLKADEEFRRLADAFNEAYEHIKTAQRGVYQAEKMAAVGRLAAGVAHEVGNPLSSISSIAQIMKRQGQTPEQTERIELIMEQVDRISVIVRNLLSFSRHGPAERRSDVDVAYLLDRAISLMRYDKRGRDVQILRDYKDGLPSISADADRLLLVFTNIILNAFDALCTYHDGPPTLEITLRPAGDEVLIQFADNGVGMKPEELDSAIDPFYTTKEPGEGTGLGLWICYQVVEEHRGRLHLSSAHHRGTRIEIRIPGHRGDETAGNGADEERTGLAGDSGNGAAQDGLALINGKRAARP
ncbi:MAG: HAMP domain-containing sensor histidine kinase [Acidobacteriota bacterium]